MIKEVSEAEFIQLTSQKMFDILKDKVNQEMMDTPEYKGDAPLIRSFLGYPIKFPNETQIWVFAEAVISKMGENRHGFQFKRLILSDEAMPDMVLDRYNELKKIKESKTVKQQTT